MTSFQLKEANRCYWILNGRLIPKSWNEEQIMKFYKKSMKNWKKRSAMGFENAWAYRNTY